MFKRTKISSCALLALGGVLLAPLATQAQEQRIEITGSRIRSLNADSPSPVQVLTSEDIAASGATNADGGELDPYRGCGGRACPHAAP